MWASAQVVFSTAADICAPIGADPRLITTDEVEAVIKAELEKSRTPHWSRAKARARVELRHGLARRRPGRHRIDGGPQNHGTPAAAAGSMGESQASGRGASRSDGPVRVSNFTAAGSSRACMR
jgi:hypothetical protein